MSDPTLTIRARKTLFSWRLEATIPPTQRGVLMRAKVPVEWLEPGRHVRTSNRNDLELRLISVDRPVCAFDPDIEALIPPDDVRVVDLKPHQMAVVTVDGQPRNALEPGRYFLWQVRHQVEAWIFDTSEHKADISEPFARLIPKSSLMTCVVPEDGTSFVRVDGVATVWLEPGRHYLWSRDRKVEVVTLPFSHGFVPATPELERMIPESEYMLIEVKHRELAIVLADGAAHLALEPGRYMVWRKMSREMEVHVFDVSCARTQIPETYWDMVPEKFLEQVVVRPYERCLLYVDGELVEVLEQGRYGVHPVDHVIETSIVDLREQELQITGQEVMTSDKVTIRVNLIAKYKIVDPEKSVEAQVSLRDAMYSEVQLAARRAIGASMLETLLEDRDGARVVMMGDLVDRGAAWGVEILQADIKDMVLPGEMKGLLNRVMEAQKQAEANVILRREETASTRAQANAAKMMEANHTLMRLKELEALKDIASTIDSLTVVVRGDEMMQGLVSVAPREMD